MCGWYNTLLVATVRSRIENAEITTVDAVSCKMPDEGQRGPSIDIDMIVGTLPASAQTEPGPEPRLNPRLDGRVVRAIWPKSKDESQTVSHSGFVISGAYHRPSLHQPPSLVLASLDILYPLFPLSFFGLIGYDVPRTLQPMHIRGLREWQQTRRIHSFADSVIVYQLLYCICNINRKRMTILTLYDSVASRILHHTFSNNIGEFSMLQTS